MSKRFGKFAVLPLIVVFAANPIAQAKDLGSEPNFEYPELMVAPLASERLLMEAREESSLAWENMAFYLTSSAITLTAGIMRVTGDGAAEGETETPADKQRGYLAVATGGAMLALSVYLALDYRPYLNGYASVKKLKNKTKRQKLTRERLAEEEINGAARFMNRLAWISLGTQLAGGITVMATSDSGTAPFFGGLVALLASPLPILFQNRWQSVAKDQARYKKRIYSPLSGRFFYHVSTRTMVPGIQFQYAF